MLVKLSIRNFALIDVLDVDFASGFSVITGETGTGKSVFLGAISMLLGQRSDAKAVRDGAERCVIEGCFDVSSYSLRDFFDANDLEYDERECIVRRELSATGRSRAFINDTPVSVAQLKELGGRLVDIHSQHRNLLLGDKDFQLNVLDVLSSCREKTDGYKALFGEYAACRRRIAAMRDEIEKSRRDEEWLRFQLDEIDAAAFHVGEQEELEQEEQELAHAEEIQAALYGASTLIDGDEGRSLLQALRDAVNGLARVAVHYPAAGDLSSRLDSNYIELKDCCEELVRRMEGMTFSPERLDFVQQRLASMYNLQKKHRVSSLPALLSLADEYRTRLDHITSGDDEILAAEKQLADMRKRLAALAGEITLMRKEAAAVLKNEITEILVTLGIPLIRFEVDFAATPDFTESGCDAVTFLFSANSSSPLQPLADVASGGEMARVMLALKSLIAGRTQQPTLIFDEIDTGISGVIAERMGRLMKRMSGCNRQVISITHLPQVAALGTSHYKVYKEETAVGTRTNIVKLGSEERVLEIARMVSGETLTEAAIDNARLLLSEKTEK